MKIENYSIIIILLLLLSSCASKKNVLLLQNLDVNKTEILSKDYASKLQPGDIITITVSSSDNIGVAPFNIFVSDASMGTDVTRSGQRIINYTIKEDGTISYPILGNLKLEGLTTLEATNYIQDLLKTYLKEPIVILEWLNFKYSVLGSVNKPGQFQTNNQRVSFFDALGNAGDLTLYASRKDVLLIREVNGIQTYTKIDLTKSDFMQSDAYYIKQNDVILVSPNKAEIQSSAYNRNTPIFVSIASLLISVIVLIRR